MGITAEDVGKEIAAERKEEARSAEPTDRRYAVRIPMPRAACAATEYRFTVSGSSRDIAMTRSCAFRAHGAVIVRGPVFEAGVWRVYLVQPLRA